MKNFKDLDLKLNYSSLNCDLINVLINPILEISTRYDRAVGFFSSTWLKEVSSGLSNFAYNNGKARIITSIELSENDWLSIQKGNENIENLIVSSVFDAVEELKTALEEKTLETLSLIVSKNIIDFRFGIPIGRLRGGIFHTKLFIFYDYFGNGIAVFGSQNDSLQATRNEETLNVFTSWDFGKEYFQIHQKNFEEKWNGNNDTLKTYKIPEVAKHIIIRARTDKSFIQSSKNKNESTLKKPLRDYQKNAIEKWKENNYKGLFEMATGAGKTFTSISAAKELLNENRELFFIILVPYQHLVEQWFEELKENDFDAICCYSINTKWFNQANILIKEFDLKIRKKVCLVATHDTAITDKFQRLVSKISFNWLLICDEVHGLGSKIRRKALFSSANYRIGLSATPSRWFDEEGSKIIEEYFTKTIIKYSLKDAIAEGNLTEYDYIPILVELNDDEISNYEELTKKIFNLLKFKNNDKNNSVKEQLEILCRKRAHIIGTAENKIPELIELVKKHIKENDSYTHNLFYCNPGEHRKVLKALSKAGLKVHEFVHTVSKDERIKVLNSFDKGEIQGLVAIKCLDEGVNIPSTQRAYILASTTNPREFIQRRGRILRLSPNKNVAYIYDFLIGPWDNFSSSFLLAKSLLKRELPRFLEFNDLSRRKNTVINIIYPFCKKYEMLKELYMEASEIYNNIIKEDYFFSSEEI